MPSCYTGKDDLKFSRLARSPGMEIKITQQHKNTAKWCVEKAQSTMGDGWRHISKDLQWGLVCANIMGVVAGADETNSDAWVRETVDALNKLCVAMIYDAK